MSVFKRYFLVLLILVVGFGSLLYKHIRADLDIRYREAVEENLVDQVQMLSVFLSNGLSREELQKSMNDLNRRRYAAKIYDWLKTRTNNIVYITDEKGKVLFHSTHPEEVGKDYHAWRDVFLTLQGKYGARSSRVEAIDPTSSVLYVAAPILVEGKRMGVVSLGKPTKDFYFFLKSAQTKLLAWFAGVFVLICLLGLMAGVWVTGPLGRIRKFVSSLHNEEHVVAPKDSEFKEVGEMIESMHASLEAKKYVEKYVQVLTHELKSPLSAIRGAVEILSEDLQTKVQKKFAGNIFTETKRMEELIQMILKVASLERSERFEELENVSVDQMVQELKEEMEPLIEQAQITVEWPQKVQENLQGNSFLLKQSLHNLILNSVEHSTAFSTVYFDVYEEKGALHFKIRDFGSGIPDYAMQKVGEKFYSLPKPKTGKKGTGLGLAFVQEVVRLHGGEFGIENREEGGVEASFWIFIEGHP